MTFRVRLLQVIVGIVAAAMVASLTVAQRQNHLSYQTLVDALLRERADAFRQEQELRLAAAADEAARLASSVRLFAALEENDPEVYKIAGDELRLGVFTFFRLLDGRGELLPPPGDADPGLRDAVIAERTLAPGPGGDEAMDERVQMGFAFLAPASGAEPEPFRLVACPIAGFDSRVGTLVLGQRLEGPPAGGAGGGEGGLLHAGLWVNGRLGKGFLPDALRQVLEKSRPPAPPSHSAQTVRAGKQRFRHEWLQLNPGSSYPPAYLILAFSLAELDRRQRQLAGRIAVTGLIALALASLAAVALSRQLARPVARLVEATQAVRRGAFDVQLPRFGARELDTLGEAFNEMAAGLALKERYHSLLQQVADPQVAEELVAGRLRLGGELRQVTIVFCDIRGYTALTVEREAAEVIGILNRHTSALTGIVQAHRGVINQFAGDAIMILFGAPKSYGDDAARAARCAWLLMEERERLNRETAPPIHIGIGIATGMVVAGCIGAENRTDYTVVGDRVNLAARLCSAARAGEILIDAATCQEAGGVLRAEPLQPLRLKGFQDPVPAFRLTSAASVPISV